MPKPKKALSQDIALYGISYHEAKKAAKSIDNEIKALRSHLEPYLDAHGEESQNGNIVAVIPHADKEVILKKTLRVSSEVLPEALEVIKELGLAEELVETVEIVREDRLRVYAESGRISEEDLARIIAPKHTRAFSVDVKDRFDESGID